MKIRNLAFCGVMASILSGWGALAADGDTIIASKAYVDAMDATKQNKLNSTGANANITVSGSGNVITDITASNGAVTVTKGSIAATDYIKNGTNALDLTMASGESKDSMAPSITAIEGMKVTSVATSNASNVKVPTEAAVRNAINTATSDTSDAITGQFENAAAAGETKAAAIEALAGDPDAMAAIHNTVADEVDIQAIPRNYNIQKGIMYLGGTGIENHSSDALTADNVEASDSWTEDSSETAVYKVGNMDDYVPTMAAVEARVKKAQADAISTAGTNVLKETSNVLSSTNTTYLPTVAAVQEAKDTTEVASESGGTITITAGTNTDDNHVPTSLTVKNDMDTLKTAINKKLNANTAITAKNNSIVNYDANGLVTGGVVFEDASGGLTGVNGETAGNMRCSTTNPCVLTYLGGTGANAKYRWTAMDTESVTAQ